MFNQQDTSHTKSSSKGKTSEQPVPKCGGKAFYLQCMETLGLPVPDFIVVSKVPGQEEWKEIHSWWEKLGNAPLAVRSSAEGEDGDANSFAGQFKTFLNVDSPEKLKQSMDDCFASIDAEAPQAYMKQFDKTVTRMNVVVQRMISPKISGVYFAIDPIKKAAVTQVSETKGSSEDFVIEFVQGLGEQLVSGAVTPYQIRAKNGEKDLTKYSDLFLREWVEALKSYSKQIADNQKMHPDMEFCIDEENKLWLLQARPITTLNNKGKVNNYQFYIDYEKDRLLKKYVNGAKWDGQTFAEFTSFPSYITFSIWKQAFGPVGSFQKALKYVGYQGFDDGILSNKDSLLERVFGRAYVNLNVLEKVFFGQIPYHFVLKPRPHLKFNWKKIDLPMILRSPKALYKMQQVSWNLQTKRLEYLQESEKDLLNLIDKNDRKPFAEEMFQNWSNDDLFLSLERQINRFANDFTFWPFVLIMMAESTIQTLNKHLEGKLKSTEKASGKLKKWMSVGLKTVSATMNQRYYEACLHASKRYSFIDNYGHRGPGELDLGNPRWAELQDKGFLFSKTFESEGMQAVKDVDEGLVEKEIASIFHGFKRSMVESEWKILKRILELREKWKMMIMQPYSNLRWILLEIGRRFHIGSDVFWLRYSEIKKLSSYSKDELNEKFIDRKNRFEAFREVSFPVLTSLDEVIKSIDPQSSTEVMKRSYEGEGISPGVVRGRVHIVRDILSENIDSWPADTILVAEATDPGWTPAFKKVKGIVVERGGILSHCAIVAREMGIPAVSQVVNGTNRLVEGQKIILDGDNGRVTIQQ